MNSKIKNYVEVLFSDLPKTRKALELKEEILSNMNERYNDYIREGKSENQAYSLVISNLGDVDEMLKEITPTEDFSKKEDYYRLRNAKYRAIATMLFILGPAVLIGSNSVGMNSDIGLVIMLVLIALGVGLNVYASSSTPRELKSRDEEEEEYYDYRTPMGRTLKLFMSLYWSIVTLSYLAWSFIFGMWHISWIIWPLAALLSQIIDTLYKLSQTKED